MLAQGNPAVASRWRNRRAGWLACLLAGLLVAAAGGAAAGPSGGDERVNGGVEADVGAGGATVVAAPTTGPCPAAPVLRFVPLGDGLWWVPAADGESAEGNRGFVSNLLLAREGRRLWLVGSGPSPAFGRVLACRVRQHCGRAITDIIDPWARAELVLGNAGIVGARSWAHRQVAVAMGEQCPHCVERLRQRIGVAASDLGDEPAQLPTLLLDGAQGRLGPFDWWALPRAKGRVVTV